MTLDNALSLYRAMNSEESETGVLDSTLAITNIAQVSVSALGEASSSSSSGLPAPKRTKKISK